MRPESWDDFFTLDRSGIPDDFMSKTDRAFSLVSDGALVVEDWTRL